MKQPLLRSLRAALVSCALALLCAAPSYAANASAFLTGTVTNGGLPIARVPVNASGNNLSVTTTTDAHGHFSFPPLPLGSYDVEAKLGKLRGIVRTDLGSA